MLGLSYAEIFLILGATAALIGPKDLPIIARTAGRFAGRSIGYVQLARGQFENIMQQTQYRQVNKELQDTMAQLDAIRHEIRSISIMNPGPLTRTLTDNPDQNAADSGPQQTAPQTEPRPKQHENLELKSAFDLSKQEYRSTALGLTDVHSQATTFARLAESQALTSASMKDGDGLSFVDDKPGLLSVLPVSAETAGLLPKRQGDPTGSDIVLEAVLEAEVARNAKDFFSQPQNQIKYE